MGMQGKLGTVHIVGFALRNRPGCAGYAPACLRIAMLPLCAHGVGAAASVGDPAAPLGKAIRVLNNQLQALASVDEQAHALEAQLEKMLTASSDHSNSGMYAYG